MTRELKRTEKEKVTVCNKSGGAVSFFPAGNPCSFRWMLIICQ